MKKSKLQFKIQNFYYLIAVFCLLFFVFSADNVQGARLYFEPQEQVIGTEKDFLIALKIDAENPINAVSVGLKISDGLTPYDINEANSIIKFFVDKPNWDATSRILTFSGIIPGGFQGKEENLLIIKFRAISDKRQATSNKMTTLNFDKEKTKVYLHTPDGIEDILQLEDLSLPIIKGKENIPVQIPDYDPPEDFKPEIVNDPNIFGGRWFLVFATQDKGSGIASYEISEIRTLNVLKLKKGAEAESPYLLKDQKLRSFIYVKAVDRAGNERISIIEPRYPAKWYENYQIWLIILLIAVFSYAIWRRLTKKNLGFRI